jgi:hypothetical protein
MSSQYRKFSSRFAGDEDKAKTFASFATFAGGGQIFEPQPDTKKADFNTPKIQSGPVKVAQVATVESEPSVPSAAYQAASAEPDGTACKVEIVELPAGGRYRKVFAHLQLRPPALIDVGRWRQCVEDAKGFLAKWGEQAEALGWTSADLFGLHSPPEKPHPSYSRLSRYDCTGLCWLLEGRSVVALTADIASIRNPDTSAVTVYRRHHKPALGPVGDSLEDFI